MDDHPLSLDELQDKYGLAIYRIARRILQDHDDTQDARQDVFVAWHCHPEYWELPESRQKMRLFCIARNKALDILRKRVAKNKFLVESEDGLIQENVVNINDDDAFDPIMGSVEDGETAMRIRAMLYYHSPQLALSFTLEDLKGDARKEVAERLGINYNALNTKRKRMIQEIKRILNVSYEDQKYRLAKLPDAIERTPVANDHTFLTYVRSLAFLPTAASALHPTLYRSFTELTFILDRLLLQRREWVALHSDKVYKTDRRREHTDCLEPEYHLILRLIEHI